MQDTKQIRTIRDFQNASIALTSQFVTRKIALAAKALYDKKMSYKQIADVLELASEAAVSTLISRHAR